MGSGLYHMPVTCTCVRCSRDENRDSKWRPWNANGPEEDDQANSIHLIQVENSGIERAVH